MLSLKVVDFVDSNSKIIDGLVPVHNPASAETPHERAILHEVSAFKPIDYVFFRRFKSPDGKHLRSSQVAAYVIDNSKAQWTEGDLASWHRELWLHGGAPLVYVAWQTRVDILSCARHPDFWHLSGDRAFARYKAAAKIDAQAIDLFSRATASENLATAADVASTLKRRFSAFRLAEGTFWDDPANQKLAKADAAAHRRLIQAIVEADQDLKGAKHPIRRKLLVLMILIKYLEDRQVFPPKLFGRFHKGARSFLDVLRGGNVTEVQRLLQYFEKRKFNGDVFSLGSAASDFTRMELKRFAALVSAKQLGGQDHFWELFSFKHIPVDVISRLYQRFVSGHGAVYTPPFLAALILDQVMPYDQMTGKEKVLDPACGSGIFLVGAFKRLVIHWRSGHEWRKPTVDELKQILADSIYGVELESAAVDLTIFSLALALCDALEPPVIWHSLKFDKLRGRNVREGDYFAPESFDGDSGHLWAKKFDIIVGNPPFESQLTAAAKSVDETRANGIPRVPDKQSAYLFLEEGLKSLSTGGALCLIQPHGLLYNSQTADFRRYLMSICRLSAVFDFVSVRGLYEGADPKTIAWYAIKESVKPKPIVHITFRRTYAVAERLGFEIDHYDWHLVPPSEAAQNPFVWRTNLLGGGRLHELASRFQKMKTLATFIAEKGNEWDYGEGFIAGKKGKRKPARFLTGKPLLPTQAFTINGIDRNQIGPRKAVVTERLFKSAYDERRYSPPLILMKAHESLPVELWDDGFIAYRDKIIGIHAPRSAADELRGIYEMLRDHKDLYRFLCSVNGSQALTGKATVPLKQDLDLLPIPADPSDLHLARWEDVIKDDVVAYMEKYVRLGQRSELLRKSATAINLKQYSNLFIQMLGSLYRNLNAQDAVFIDGLIAQAFYFGSRPDVKWLGDGTQKALRELIYDESRDALVTVRVVRYYEGNVILIVKPDRLRYWIRSTAIRDADDTLADLRKEGW